MPIADNEAAAAADAVAAPELADDVAACLEECGGHVTTLVWGPSPRAQSHLAPALQGPGPLDSGSARPLGRPRLRPRAASAVGKASHARGGRADGAKLDM